MKLILVADGGCLDNPGPMYVMYRFLHQLKDGISFRSKKFLIDLKLNGTNNVAEYLAIIYGLKQLKEYMDTVGCCSTDISILVISDSKLIVKQLLGEYKVRNKHLVDLYNILIEMLSDFKTWEIVWKNRNIVNMLIDGDNHVCMSDL